MASCRDVGHSWPNMGSTVLHPTLNRRMRTCSTCGTEEWWENKDGGRHGYVYPAGTQYVLPYVSPMRVTVRPSVGEHVAVRGADEFRGQVTRIGEEYVSVVPTDGFCPPAHEPGEAVLVEPHEIVATLPADLSAASIKSWLRSGT